MGFDLNRHWQDPSPWAHPTLHATKQYLMNLHSNPVTCVLFCCVCFHVYKFNRVLQSKSVFPLSANLR